jgi:putative ATP-binding cassette transporter
VTTLSTGQRKRLALVASYLENKPILLYDEVAADLDPVFRKQFYEVYLGEQRDRGRTIVAVSHDDRYFHVADRVFRMEYGTLKEVERS